jgi:hypothetical protein
MIDLEHREIRRWIIAHGISDMRPTVDESRSHFARPMHDVAIGEQETIGREKETRPRARGFRRRAATTPLGHSYTAYLEVNDSWPDSLNRADHRSRIGVERLAVGYSEGLDVGRGDHAADS